MIALLKTLSIRRLQTGTQCSYVNYTRNRVSVCGIFASAPHSEPASPFNSASRDLNFRAMFRCGNKT